MGQSPRIESHQRRAADKKLWGKQPLSYRCWEKEYVRSNISTICSSSMIFLFAPAVGLCQNFGTLLHGPLLLLRVLEHKSWSVGNMRVKRKSQCCPLIQREDIITTDRRHPSQSQIPVMKRAIAKVRTRRLFKKHYSEFPGRWMDEESTEVFFKCFWDELWVKLGSWQQLGAITVLLAVWDSICTDA